MVGSEPSDGGGEEEHTGEVAKVRLRPSKAGLTGILGHH